MPRFRADSLLLGGRYPLAAALLDGELTDRQYERVMAVVQSPGSFGSSTMRNGRSETGMKGGFACVGCDQLFEERPESCPECGTGMLEPLTFSEYRSRRRAGEELLTEPTSCGRVRTAVLLVLALGLMVIGVAAIGIGATAMVF